MHEYFSTVYIIINIVAVYKIFLFLKLNIENKHLNYFRCLNFFLLSIFLFSFIKK